MKSLKYLVLSAAFAFSVTASATEQWSLVGFPVPYYMPETGLGVAASLVWSRKVGSSEEYPRSDSVPLSAFLTTRGQYGFIASPNLFFDGAKWELRSSFGYSYFPNFYYGMGSESPDSDKQVITSRILLLQSSWHRRFASGLVLGAGVLARSTSHAFERIPPEGVPTGTEGGTTLGIGPVIEWDTRNHGFNPTKGSWLKYQAYWFAPAAIGNYAGVQHTLDLRSYYAFVGPSVFALQGIASTSSAEVPFDAYLPLGLRGVSDDRLRDRSVVMTQMEFRSPIYKHLGGVIFAGTGAVAEKWADLKPTDFVVMAGGGLRFMVEENEKINLRLDVGFSRFGPEPYFQLQESF